MKINGGLLARVHSMRHVSAAVAVGITNRVDARDVSAHATGIDIDFLFGNVEIHLVRQ